MARLNCAHLKRSSDIYTAPDGLTWCRACRREARRRYDVRHKTTHAIPPPLYELVDRLKSEGLLHVHWRRVNPGFAWVIQVRRSRMCRDEGRCFLIRVTDTPT